MNYFIVSDLNHQTGKWRDKALWRSDMTIDQLRESGRLPDSGVRIRQVSTDDPDYLTLLRSGCPVRHIEEN